MFDCKGVQHYWVPKACPWLLVIPNVYRVDGRESFLEYLLRAWELDDQSACISDGALSFVDLIENAIKVVDLALHDAPRQWVNAKRCPPLISAMKATNRHLRVKGETRKETINCGVTVEAHLSRFKESEIQWNASASDEKEAHFQQGAAQC